MSVLKSWTGGAIVLLALAGGLRAEVTVSQSNNPAAGIDQGLVTLLSQDRAGLEAVPDSRLAAITTAPKVTPKRKAGQPAALGYSAEWLASQPEATGDGEFRCLADALYFEARGESIEGQAAVAEVILNRVDDLSYPGSICGVVNQGNRNGCQFSYTCDGRADRVSDPTTYGRVAKIARAMIDGAPRQLTDGATHFHTPAVRPDWSRRFTRTARIGAHIFYRAPVRTASN